MQKFVGYPSISTVPKTKNPDSSSYYIEEKYDGSQLSFRLENTDTDNKMNLTFYNKNNKIKLPNHNFDKSITMLIELSKSVDINPNYIYHGEAISSIKHNANTYERIPKYYYMAYDIYDMQNNKYLDIEQKHLEFTRIGLEYATVIYNSTNMENITAYDKCIELIKLIESEQLISSLGGTPEGIVLKKDNHLRKGKLVHTKCKMVTDAFKERNHTKQPNAHLTPDEFLQYIGMQFATTARFIKQYSHLSEQSLLTGNFEQDLKLLIIEADNDFDKEYMGEMKAYLWAEFGQIIRKYSRKNLNEWFLINVIKDTKSKESSNNNHIEKEKTEIEKLLFIISQEFTNTDQYAIIYNRLKEQGILNNTPKDYVNLIANIDQYFDETNKENVINRIWNEFGSIIKDHARTGFVERVSLYYKK
jgi:hypothetical protein